PLALVTARRGLLARLALLCAGLARRALAAGPLIGPLGRLGPGFRPFASAVTARLPFTVGARLALLASRRSAGLLTCPRLVGRPDLLLTAGVLAARALSRRRRRLLPLPLARLVTLALLWLRARLLLGALL